MIPMCSVWRVEILHSSLKIIENVLRIKSDEQNYVRSQLSLLPPNPTSAVYSTHLLETFMLKLSYIVCGRWILMWSSFIRYCPQEGIYWTF